jgi:fructose-1-phosphate kinase PfkB-like protein
MIAELRHLSTKNVVVTVTLNPSVDRTLWVPGFEAGRTLLVERSATVAGGKGVNVSRALGTLGTDSTATGFIGREGSGEYLAMLEREGIRHDFVRVDGTPRVNVTILSEAGAPETHIREKGPVVTEAALLELEQKLQTLLEGASRRGSVSTPPAHGPRVPEGTSPVQLAGKPLVVISGGLPPGLGPRTYARLIELVHGCGAWAALDASGEPLKEGLAARPDLIKPNAQEVSDSLGFYPRSAGDLSRAIARYRGSGVETVMISLGKDGVVFSRGAGAVHARVKVDAPVNSVGSGDASIAGGIAGILSGFPDQGVAGLACAVGAANTLMSGACVFRLDDVEKLLAEVEFRALV